MKKYMGLAPDKFNALLRTSGRAGAQLWFTRLKSGKVSFFAVKDADDAFKFVKKVGVKYTMVQGITKAEELLARISTIPSRTLSAKSLSYVIDKASQFREAESFYFYNAEGNIKWFHQGRDIDATTDDAVLMRVASIILQEWNSVGTGLMVATNIHLAMMYIRGYYRRGDGDRAVSIMSLLEEKNMVAALGSVFGLPSFAAFDIIEYAITAPKILFAE
jgi:hypothetical protein